MKVSVLDWEADQELPREAGHCPVVSVRSYRRVPVNKGSGPLIISN